MSDVSNNPEPAPTVIEPAPVVLDPAIFAVEDTATELPIADAPAATAPVQVEPAEPASTESAAANTSEPEPVTSQREPVTREPEPIAAEPEPSTIVNSIAEQSVSDATPIVPMPPAAATASPAPVNGNNIDVVPERVTSTAAAREAPAPSGGQQVKARSNIPFYLLALTTMLALGAVAYQTYLLRQSLNIIDRASQRMDRVQQQNEYVRACRDLSDAYFLVKQRVAPLMAVPDRSNIAGAARISEINRVEAQDAVARFVALGAFLGNAQDAAARERYGELSRVLTRLAEDAKGKPLTEFDKAFEPADKLFALVNSDCARMSQSPKT
jgi:hypothetical protein